MQTEGFLPDLMAKNPCQGWDLFNIHNS